MDRGSAPRGLMVLREDSGLVETQRRRRHCRRHPRFEFPWKQPGVSRAKISAAAGWTWSCVQARQVVHTNYDGRRRFQKNAAVFAQTHGRWRLSDIFLFGGISFDSFLCESFSEGEQKVIALSRELQYRSDTRPILITAPIPAKTLSRNLL